jgi:guanyl-specific ribonuclease Sa
MAETSPSPLSTPDEPSASPESQLPSFLPPAAVRTLALIADDGPFPHRQDGEVFGNYEHRLPAEPRGYYHEYTVDTPGAHDRGARRIITGGNPPVVYYYTDDHYRSFRKFTVPR